MHGSLLLHEPLCTASEKLDVVQRQSGFCLVLCAFVQLKLMAFWNSDAVVCLCRRLLPSWDSRYSMLAKLLDDQCCRTCC